MADIDIQRKRNGTLWPWVLGLVLLAAGVWLVVEYADRDDESAIATAETQEEAAPADVEPVDQPPAPTAGARLQAWVRDSAQALEQMGRQHEYTREGLSRAIAGLDGLVARDTAPDVQQRLDAAREQVQRLGQSEPTSAEHANQAKQAFTAIVDVLETLRQRPHLREADLEQPIADARQAANALQAGTPLLEQRATVQRFFEQIAAAIEAAERHYVT